MSKELKKMREVRIQRNGVKAVMLANEVVALTNRQIIRELWDKEDKAENRKALYKAHKSLAKARVNINECQRILKAMKLQLKKLNRQHDICVRAVNEHINGYNQTSLLG